MATTTITSTDRGYTIDATSGTYDIALDTAANLGAGFPFGVYNSGSGTVTINPNGAETIRSPAGSAATLALSQGQGVLVLCDGTGFEVVASTGIAPSPGSVISGLTTGRIVDAASATTIETAASISTDQTLSTTSTIASKATAAAGIALDKDSATGNFTLSLSPANLTGARRWSFPDRSDTVAGLAAQTFTGVQTFTLAPVLSALTASRLVRTDGSKALESNAALTSTRIMYADGSGWPTGSADLTFSGTLLTLGTGATGGINIAATTGATLTVASTTDSSSKDTGCVVIEGGIGIEKALVAGGSLSAGISSSTHTLNGQTIFQKNSSNWVARIAGGSDELAQLGANVGCTSFGVGMGAVTTSAGSYISTMSTGAITVFGTSASSYGGWSTTGVFSVLNTTDATTSSTGAELISGGLNVAKNILARQGLHIGVSNVATAAGTTTITNASVSLQNYTGSTTQTEQLPAANVLGAGIGFFRIIKNKSSGTVTIQRAGSDTIWNTSSVTSITLTAGQGCILFSDGVSEWSIIRA